MAGAYAKALKDFKTKYGYEFSSKLIEQYVENVIKKNSDTSSNSKFIRDKIKNWMYTETGKHETYRQELILRSKANPNDEKLKEEIAKMPGRGEVVNDCISVLEALAADYAEQYKRKYSPLPWFGLKGKDYAKLMRDGVETYKYSVGRRFELFRAYGIKNPKFMNELNDLDSIQSYENATDNEKEKIHQIYITKKLNEERLKKHIFLWKWINWSETKAMKAYVKAAEAKLKAVNFPIEDPPQAANDYANESYVMATDPPQKAEIVDDCASWQQHVDAKVEEERLKRQNVKAEQKAKADEQRLKQEEEQKAKAQENAVKQFAKDLSSTTKRREKLETAESLQAIANANDNNKSLEDRFFDTKFRPSLDPEEYKKMDEVMRRMAPTMPKEAHQKMRHVFFQNTKKMSAVGKHLKEVASMNEDQRKLAENRLIINLYQMESDVENKVFNPMSKDKSKGYAPLKYDDIKVAPVQKDADNAVNNVNEESKALHMQLENEINKDLNNDKAPVVANEENDKIVEKSMN